jgi:hypothetical protein
MVRGAKLPPGQIAAHRFGWQRWSGNAPLLPAGPSEIQRQVSGRSSGPARVLTGNNSALCEECDTKSLVEVVLTSMEGTTRVTG